MAITYDPTNQRGYAQVILGIVTLVLSCIFVFARIVARFTISSLGKDDILVLISLGFYAAFIISGAFLHEAVPGAKPLSINANVLFMNWLLVNEIMYCWCIIFLKLSLGYFFLRIVVDSRQRKAIYICMVVSTVFNLLCSFWVMSECGNPKDFVKNFAAGKCPPVPVQMAVAYLPGVANCITDFVFVSIPIFIVRGSTLSKDTKIYVCSILGLASVGVISSIVRLVYLHAFWDGDMFFSSVTAFTITCIVELATGIIASSIATLRPLVRTCLGLPETSFQPSTETTATTNTQSRSSSGWRFHSFKKRSPTSTVDTEELGINPQMLESQDGSKGVFSCNQTVPLPTDADESPSLSTEEIPRSAWKKFKH